MGYFDEEAVDISIPGLESGMYTIHAALLYGEECFGPFSTTI